MAKFRPVKYVQEVKNEMDKVTWPSRRETTVTSIMVLIFVFILIIFFTFLLFKSIEIVYENHLNILSLVLLIFGF